MWFLHPWGLVTEEVNPVILLFLYFSPNQEQLQILLFFVGPFQFRIFYDSANSLCQGENV